MRDWRQEYRKSQWWRDRTFLDDLRDSVRKNPKKPAVVTCRAGAGDRVLDYGELSLLTERCAGAFLALGVRPGDMVAMQLTNRWELAPLVLACMRVGARICTLMPNYRRRNLVELLDLTQPRVFITMSMSGDFPLAELAVELAAETPSIEHVLVADGDVPEGALSFEEWFFGKPWEEHLTADLDACELAPDDPYVLFFTSGTTSDPKGAVHSQNTLYAAIRGEADVFGLDENLVMMTVSIYTHYTGFVQGMLMPLMLGGTVVFQDTYDSGAALDLMTLHGVTMLYAAPWFLRDLIDSQRAEPRAVSALRCLVSGSAPVPPHLVEEVRQEFGLRLFALWGMTENGPVTITRLDDPEDWAAHSDGSPISDMELHIKPLGGRDEADGVLWVRGPTQCLGYYGHEDLYASYLDEDGFFNTGDVVRSDGRGGIRLVGRVEDAITHHAITVPAPVVEAAIGRHPKVHRVAVIGVPVGRGEDETVCAVVVPTDDSLTLAELRRFLEDAGIMDVFLPQRLELLGELPVTLTGKVRKVELKERFALR